MLGFFSFFVREVCTVFDEGICDEQNELSALFKISTIKIMFGIVEFLL